MIKAKNYLIFWILVLLCLISNFKALAASKRDGSAKGKRILLVSLGIVGHAVPLARIGSEITAKCCARSRKDCVVDFASHGSVEHLWIEETVSVRGSPCLGRFINLGELPKVWFDKLNKISTDPSLFRGTLSVFTDLYLESLPSMYDAVDEHMRGVDLAVVDIGTLGAIEKARAFNVTLVVHSPTVWADSFGQFEPPHWLPAFGSGLSKDMTLAERCLNALLPRLLSVALQPALMRVNKLRFDSNLAPYQSSHQVFQDVRIVSSTALGFEYSRLVPPIHAYVGPILPRRTSSDLVKFPRRGLKRFLRKVKHTRLIIIRFGSTLPLDFISLQSFKLGLEWLVSKENASIIWYLPEDRLEQLKPFKSRRILAVSTFNVDTHFGLMNLDKPKVALSISSCGMASVQESLIFAIPVLCVPIVADQADVAARLKDSGAGLILAKEDISPASVLLTVNKLLNDKQYVSSAQIIRRILEMVGGRERAAIHILSAFYHSDDFLMLKQSLSWHKRVGLDVSAVFTSLFVTFGMGFLLHARFRHGRKYGF